jgi:hypothetical protein
MYFKEKSFASYDPQKSGGPIHIGPQGDCTDNFSNLQKIKNTCFIGLRKNRSTNFDWKFVNAFNLGFYIHLGIV